MNATLFNHCLKNIHNRRCFEKLYEFYYDRIVVHINNKYHMGDLAEDVAQECFINLINLKEYKYIEHYTSWLYKICENIALRKLSKENIELQKLYFPQEESIEISKNEIFGDFQEDIESLDVVSQEIFYLYYVEAYSFKEISEILGLTQENVRQKHHRGLKALRKNNKLSQKRLFSVLL